MINSEKINDYIDQYLNGRPFEVAPATFVSEKSKAKQLKKIFKNRLLKEIRHSDIHEQITRLHKQNYKNKTINEFLIILRAVFHRAELDGVIERNPMSGISNFAIDIPSPDPFTKTELAQLHKTDVACINGKNASELNSLTGVRIGELLALAWEDVDWERKELHINRAKVLQHYKVPKTPGSIRVVELNDLALKILREQYALTGKRRARKISVLKSDNKSTEQQTLHFMFYNSKTNQPFLHAAQFNKDFFTPFLKQAGVKHRGVGQLRHTFASQCLTAGISKEWIATQMGHTGTHMIDLHYGRWIKADAPDCARAVMTHLADVFGEAVTPPAKPSISSGESICPELLALMKSLQSRPELLALIQGVVGGAA